MPWCQDPGCNHTRLVPTEGTTGRCATRNKAIRKQEEEDAKPAKQFKPLQRSSISKDPKQWKNTYSCSDGEKMTEEKVRGMLKTCINFMDDRRKAANISLFLCDAYNMRMAVIDHDHTIAKARCKELGKTELIWDEDNIEYSSRQAHQEWESYKDGAFLNHRNFEKRMNFLKIHDPEMYEKRIQVWAEFNKPKETV